MTEKCGGCPAVMEKRPSAITGNLIPVVTVRRETGGELELLADAPNGSVFILDKDGRVAPIPRDQWATRFLRGEDLRLNHFVDCPARERFQRR